MSTNDRAPLPVFFVHVMKTGGTSFTRRLSTRYGAAVYPSPAESGDGYPEKLSVGRLQARLADDPPRLVSVHLPAWTADLAPTFLRVTVLREPVARTVSHLRQIARGPGMPDTPEKIWRETALKSQLTDYQTRVFAPRKAPPQFDLDGATSEQLREFQAAIIPAMLTGVGHAEPMTEDDLQEAQRSLAIFDVVGITDDLDGFARRVSAACRADLDSLGQENVSPASPPVADWLHDEITAATTLDRRLYETARQLARRT